MEVRRYVMEPDCQYTGVVDTSSIITGIDDRTVSVEYIVVN